MAQGVSHEKLGGMVHLLPREVGPTISSALAVVPREIVLQCFSFLSTKDLARAKGVCKSWKALIAPSICSDVTQLPNDLMSHAFSFLSTEDLASASRVCKEWQVSVSHVWDSLDLRRVIPSLQVIDQTVWERHFHLAALGMDARGAPAIDRRVAIPFLKRLSSHVEENAGITLLTMPKGLTFSKLIALVSAPKQGHATRIKFIWPRIKEMLGDVAVDKTYTVAITNSVLKESRNKAYGIQNELAQRNGGELPGVLTVAISGLFNKH